MKSATLGKCILEAEITNISKHGFWLLLADEELFVAFKQFPWFTDASVEEIVNVAWLHPHHLYWPDLDVDLAVESIRTPKKFPLLSKMSRHSKRPSRRAKLARSQT